jgi:hypothetical protein
MTKAASMSDSRTTHRVELSGFLEKDLKIGHFLDPVLDLECDALVRGP